MENRKKAIFIKIMAENSPEVIKTRHPRMQIEKNVKRCVKRKKSILKRHQGKTAAEHQRQKGEGEFVLFTKDQADCSILTTTETRTQE